jgi:hypothetical protein
LGKRKTFVKSTGRFPFVKAMFESGDSHGEHFCRSCGNRHSSVKVAKVAELENGRAANLK